MSKRKVARYHDDDDDDDAYYCIIMLFTSKLLYYFNRLTGSAGTGMMETIIKISSDCEHLQSLFIERKVRMNQEEAESSTKALKIIETAERNAAEIIDEAVSNATSIESDMELKVQQMEKELLHWKEEQELIAAIV